jgi:hypothetical protein
MVAVSWPTFFAPRSEGMVGGTLLSRILLAKRLLFALVSKAYFGLFIDDSRSNKMEGRARVRYVYGHR